MYYCVCVWGGGGGRRRRRGQRGGTEGEMKKKKLGDGTNITLGDIYLITCHGVKYLSLSFFFFFFYNNTNKE